MAVEQPVGKRGVLQHRRSSRRGCELTLELVHRLSEVAVALDVAGEAADGGENRAVVASADTAADLGEALAGQLA